MAARDYVIGAMLGGALVSGLVIWKPLHKTTPLDTDISFSDYNFFDNKKAEPNEGFVTINGSLHRPDLSEDDANRPVNNTYTIQCVQTEMKCHVASAEQIGDKQIDEITLAEFKISEWGLSEIIATDTDDDDPFSCVKNTLTIERSSGKTYYVAQPINVEKPICAKAATKTIKYTITGSRTWRYLHKATGDKIDP